MGQAATTQQRALRDYGINLGTAFQLIDDLLDFTVTDEVLGKAAGVDLLEGKLTLPLIYLLEEDSGMHKDLQAIMREGSYQHMTRETLLRAVERTGALTRARERAYEYAEAARTALDELPTSEYSDALRSLPTYIIERDR
jgi:octaprenyl-diphosphate synthase